LALFQKGLIFENFLLHLKVKNVEAITPRSKTLVSHKYAKSYLQKHFWREIQIRRLPELFLL